MGTNMRGRIFIAAVCSLAWAFLPAQAASTMPETFQARVTLELCPEYTYGGVVLDVDYTVGTDPTVHSADIVSQSIDTANRTATLVLRFPSTYGTLPFNVIGFCRNSAGTSAASNSLSVSNCDALALYDNDRDGIANNLEDINCDNSFSPGDVSNPDNVDTDGDGVRDLVERVSGTDPTNAGSSPRPYVFSGGVFDPDHDGNANPMVWRPGNATFYVRDFGQPGVHIAVPFGIAGDVPFTYTPQGSTSNVGVIRNVNNALHWYFNGPGVQLENGSRSNDVQFGIFGDNLIPGPWETPGITNPAVARLYNGEWSFFIFKRDGSVKIQNWGGNGDIPKVEDHDGDGVFDIAVYRPGDQKTYIIRSTDSQPEIYTFGSGTADHTVRGDYDGDGIDDISFWEPVSGMFSSMTSRYGFNDTDARAHDSRYYVELQLGLYYVHLPLSWNTQAGKVLYTVVDHASGWRYWRAGNELDSPVQGVQWGIAGDHQG